MVGLGLGISQYILYDKEYQVVSHEIEMVTVTAGASGAWETLSLPIAKGDELVVTVEMFYEANADNRNNSAPNFNVFLQNSPNYGSSTVDGQTSLSPFQLSNFSLGFGLTLPSQSNDNVPNAYLAVIIYDEDGNVEKEEYRHVQVGDQTGWGTRTIDLTSFLSTTSVNKGRAEIFVYNQSNTDIWFDDLEIKLQGALIAEEKHYYPFGLELAGLGKNGIPQQRYTFNGQSEKQTDLNGGNSYFYETDFRSYDPQLGRFHAVDPLTFMVPAINPYQFAFNNPISYNDPTGLMPDPNKRAKRKARRAKRKAERKLKRAQRKANRAAKKALRQSMKGKPVTGNSGKLRYPENKASDDDDDDDNSNDEISGISWGPDGIGGIGAIDDFVIRSKKRTLLSRVAEFFLDFTPAPDAHALFSGKDMFTGEDRSRLGAAFWLTTGFFGGKALKVVVKWGGKFLKLFKRGKKARKGGKSPKTKGTCCFVAGTLVLTEEGHKEIQDIKEGDLVWAYDEDTGNLALKEVVKVYIVERNHVFKIYIGDEVIEATNDHPFFIGGKWVHVEDLSVGDSVQLYNGEKRVIERIEYEEGTFTVYNFTVADFHTYYVTEADILVHNCEDKLIPWSSAGVRQAAKKLADGATEVTVKTRAEAEELFLRLYQGKGFENTTGMSATEAKNFFGKTKTYHWDDVVDESGRVLNHGSNNPHGAMKHLQIHNETNKVIRIFFK